MPKIAALFVGINKYPAPNRLAGCVPDIKSLTPWLTQNRGLIPKYTHTLLDGNATRGSIIGGLQWLAFQNADTSLFVYSGHGAQVPDLDGDEDDKFDEAIVPVDFQHAGLITDDVLQREYLKFPSDSKLVIHFDSCHSGNSDRSFSLAITEAFYKFSGKRKPRFIKPDQITEQALKATQDGPSARWRKLPAETRREVVLLAGCRDFETSADAYISRAVGYRGAFTYYVEQAIRTLGPNATYTQISAETQRLLGERGYSQIPPLKGPAEWLSAPIYS